MHGGFLMWSISPRLPYKIANQVLAITRRQHDPLDRYPVLQVYGHERPGGTPDTRKCHSAVHSTTRGVISVVDSGPDRFVQGNVL